MRLIINLVFKIWIYSNNDNRINKLKIWIIVMIVQLIQIK